MNDKEAMQALKKLFSEHELDLPNTDSLEVLQRAVAALEKRVPKKVIIEPWSPAKCPTCGVELSKSLGDGYYKHLTRLQVCPNSECCQRLYWREDDE